MAIDIARREFIAALGGTAVAGVAPPFALAEAGYPSGVVKPHRAGPSENAFAGGFHLWDEHAGHA